ncbi:hypothetical protein BC835DRAFT_710076 [Cytidiella melzeri]|nr:hypothetical protein BC835DRAFT_710076 [Cytidiella melzeri]
MTSAASFMQLPIEVRLEVYAFCIANIRCLNKRRQPFNHHFRLLRVCKQMNAEAHSIVFTYVSLLHEQQIRSFIQAVPDLLASRIVYADTANDGRVIQPAKGDHPVAVPLSQLNIALRRMSSLKHLRVFECQQGLPVQLDSKYSKRFVLNFEDAMFPIDHIPQLETYELYLSSSTKVTVLNKVGTSKMQKLRLSGSCSLSSNAKLPAARQVALEGVTGNYFDRRKFDDWCQSPVLTTFVYALEDKIGFEIRDDHLHSLAYGPGRHLRKLVLLGCSRLASTVLADCLRQMASLEYLALSITTVAEQRTNIMTALPHLFACSKLAL